jgi:hypothetical protein
LQKLQGFGRRHIHFSHLLLLVANHYRRPSDFAIHILLLVSPERSSSRRIPVAIDRAGTSDGKF